MKFQEVADELSHSQRNVSLREPIAGFQMKSGDFGATAGGQEVRRSFSTESRDEPKPPLQKKWRKSTYISVLPNTEYLITPVHLEFCLELNIDYRL